MFRHHSMRSVTALLASLTIMSLAPHAVSAAEEHLMPPGSDPIAIYREAGINEGQERKILSMASAYEKEQDAKAHELINHIKKLKGLSLVPDLDEDAIIKEQTEINRLQGEMAMDKVHLLIIIRKVLNKDQRNRLVGLMQNRVAPDNLLQQNQPAPVSQ